MAIILTVGGLWNHIFWIWWLWWLPPLLVPSEYKVSTAQYFRGMTSKKLLVGFYLWKTCLFLIHWNLIKSVVTIDLSWTCHMRTREPTPVGWKILLIYYHQFSSVQSLSRVRLFETPWIAALQASLSITQTHVHWVGDAIQPSHPLSSPSPAPNPSQHQGLFQWANSLREVAKVLEFQLQHQSFQWTLSTDLL